MEKIDIVAFRAVDDKEFTIRYIVEHHKVLEDIGVSSALKLDYSWCVDPESTIIAAFHERLGMIGGVRIQVGRADYPMAMEKAINNMDPYFRGVVHPYIENGTAELCGLWVANRFLGHGLPRILVPAGVAVAGQLNITSLLTFAAEYTLNLTLEAGFTRMEETGNKGEFLYPVPNIRSYAMKIMDLPLLAHSDLETRHRILSMRLRPVQNVALRPKSAWLNAQFDLRRDVPKSQDLGRFPAPLRRSA